MSVFLEHHCPTVDECQKMAEACILTEDNRAEGRNELQPDLALLRWRDNFYRSAMPGLADVLLIVEVERFST